MLRMIAVCSLACVLFGEALAQQPAPTAPAKTSTPPRERIVCHMRHLPAADVADALSNLLSVRMESGHVMPGSVAIVPVAATNSLLLGGSSEDVKQVLTLLEQLDRAPASVVLQVLLAEVTLPKAGQEGPPSAVLQALEQSSLADMLSKQGSSLVAQGSLEKLEPALKALEQAGQMHLLARPRILTLDNQQALIQIGRRIPVPTSAPSKEGTPRNVVLENTGLILKVTTRVTPDGPVVLALNLDQSQPTPTDDGLVQTETKSLQTTVTVPDGQTVILADLITESDEGRRELLLLVSPQVQAAKAKTP